MSETRPDPITEELPATRVGTRWMYNYTARMMKLGAGDEQMLSYLTQQGIDPQAALEIVDTVRKAQKPKSPVSARQLIEKTVKPALQTPAQPAARRNVKPLDKLTSKPTQTRTDFLIDMILGGAVCVLGFVIVIASITTSPNGAAYFLACGAMTFGALRFYRGFIQFRNKQG